MRNGTRLTFEWYDCVMTWYRRQENVNHGGYAGQLTGLQHIMMRYADMRLALTERTRKPDKSAAAQQE